RLQPGALEAAAVATDVRVVAALRISRYVIAPVAAERAVLQADVVVVDGQDPHRPDGERVPVAGELRRPVAGQLEPGLIGQVALRPVTHLVLMVPGRRHPGPVPRRAHDVGEVRGPGRYGRVADVRVAQVAVHQVEQGVERVDGIDDVAGVRRVGAEP